MWGNLYPNSLMRLVQAVFTKVFAFYLKFQRINWKCLQQISGISALPSFGPAPKKVTFKTGKYTLPGKAYPGQNLDLCPLLI